MANHVNITSTGIKKVLRLYNEKQALAEYIWNGFDAKADTIRIDYTYNELGTLESLKVSDNGYGINFAYLKDKFNPFYESEKAMEQRIHLHKSTMHGKNGVGRLTFFTFAHHAEWNTTVKQKGYTLYINSTEKNPSTIYVHVKDLQRIDASNTAKVKTSGDFDLQVLQIFLKDDAKANVNAKVGSLYTDMQDQSDLKLSGSSAEHHLVRNEVSKLNLNDFVIAKL
jgi:hypothetical protein